MVLVWLQQFLECHKIPLFIIFCKPFFNRDIYYRCLKRFKTAYENPSNPGLVLLLVSERASFTVFERLFFSDLAGIKILDWTCRGKFIISGVKNSSELKVLICILRPTLNNLSHSLTMRRRSNMIGFTWNCIQCFEIEPWLNWNRFLADQQRGLNSLNSASGVNIF